MQPEAPASVTLASLLPGQSGLVRDTDALSPGDAAYLRALGIRPRSRVRLCRQGGPCIVEVGCGCGGPCCRVALSRHLAMHVIVEPMPA